MNFSVANFLIFAAFEVLHAFAAQHFKELYI